MNDSAENNCAQLAVGLRLIVDDASGAISFYTSVFEATEKVRFSDPSGKIVHAEIEIGATTVSLSESDGEINRSPSQVGGTPVIAMLTTTEVDAVAARMVASGGSAIIPVADREYGPRDGRYADPEGHLWILSQSGEDLTDDEVQQRLDPNQEQQ